MRLQLLPFLIAALASCVGSPSSEPSRELADDHSAPASILQIGNRYSEASGDRYLDEIQPILASRCAVCHSCTNGPCQLNLTSYAALQRGVDRVDPYDFGLFDKDPTRVSDNFTEEQWRDRGFSSILSDKYSGLAPKESMLMRTIEHGRNNRSVQDPGGTSLDMQTVRHLAKMENQECSLSTGEYDDFEEDHPNGGMPWALPTVSDQEYATLKQWIADGAPGPSATALAKVQAPEQSSQTQVAPSLLIADWEDFLNASDLRSQLVARYVFEHSFYANLHFKENPGEFYRIVRSRTGPSQPIVQIVTELPTDSPGVQRVYYRLQKVDRIIEAKSHVAWQVDKDEVEHMRAQFLDRAWTLATLPGFDDPNPFAYFQAIPAAARSEFMWRNSRMIKQSFARGTICMVQTATYAVDEYYWMWFLRPESDPSVQDPSLGLRDLTPMYGRDQELGTELLLGAKFGEPFYRAAFESSLRKLKPEGLGIDDIWFGEGEDPDAWLTFHRHQISTEVNTAQTWPHYARPRSVWLMSYANFERMFYNAAARYPYWGDLNSQFNTYNYQIYTRTEAEDLYISLFSNTQTREELRDRNTTTLGRLKNDLWLNYAKGRPATTPSHWTELELQRAVYERMGKGITGTPDNLNHFLDHRLSARIDDSIADIEGWEAGLRSLTERKLEFARYLPNLVVVRLDGEQVYTLIANRGYAKDKVHLLEAQARRPELDTMIATRGLFGAQPHLFIDLGYDEAVAFLKALKAVRTQHDWDLIRQRFAIARNSEELWPMVDWLHQYQARERPSEAGILEMRFYDVDQTPF